MLMASHSSSITIQTLPSDPFQTGKRTIEFSSKSMNFDDEYRLSSDSSPNTNHRRSTRRLINETDCNEPDPNVFLISSDTNSHNTIRKTKHDVKRFVMYIDEQFGEQMLLHTLSAESLCRYLKHYFENTKKFDGSEYEPDTLRSFLLSIERYLRSKNYPYNLMESPLFQSCRQIITNKREEWKRLGMNNHLKLSTTNVLNVQNLTFFDRTKPDGLLLEMYVHILKLSQLNIAQLLWGDISLIEDQYLVCNQHRIENQTIRLCATPHQPSTCPVQAYRLYATHRPPQCNTPQSPFFLMPRSTTTHHIWYKATAAGKNLEPVLQKAIQNATLIKPSMAFPSNESSPSVSILPAKSIESSPSKRMKTSIQPLNLSIISNIEDENGTITASPSNSLSNEVIPPAPSSSSSSSIITSPIWDESVNEILLTVAKQRETRMMKINALRSYLEEKLGFVEFLCLYHGFKSEPKFTFQGTPWEHYQRFLPVLFTLLTLDNTTV